MRLVVNGQEHEVAAPGEARLLGVLRDRLGLTAARFGCGSGDCGACFVLVDGRATASCLMELRAAAGHDIRTVEGLADGDTLHPLQEAFIVEDAMQCGYCTSGMLMSALALLAENPSPSERQIRDALAGNLCRCGVYGRVVRAIRRVAK